MRLLGTELGALVCQLRYPPPTHQPKGLGLPDRLVATIIATWTDRLEDTTTTASSTVAAAIPALHAALYGRAAAAIRDWLGTTDLNIDIDIRPAGAEPGITDAQVVAMREGAQSKDL